MTQKSDIKKKIIFIPHYKGSFESLLYLALYVRNNKIGIPHFTLYFDDDWGVKQTLKEYGIDFSIYKIGFFAKVPVVGRVVKFVTDLIYSTRLVSRLSPIQAMVCAVESRNLEYALIAVLNRRNVNTIVLQWAQTVPKEYYKNVRANKNKNNKLSAVKEYFKNYAARLFGVKVAKFYGEGQAKYFAVMGNHYHDMFCQQGAAKDKLVVTGHPEHDRLYELSQNIAKPEFRHNVISSFNLRHSRPIWILAREAIAYFNLVPEEKDKEDISAVLEILSVYHPQVQIVLKLHPRDCEEYYDFVRQKFPHVILIHECDLHKLIAICDLYISQISSTMMWAIALDKPVISYDFNNQPYWHYFRDKEGIIKADSPDGLAEKIRAIHEKGLNCHNYKNHRVAREKYMVFDGKCCGRIAELITK